MDGLKFLRDFCGHPWMKHRRVRQLNGPDRVEVMSMMHADEGVRIPLVPQTMEFDGTVEGLLGELVARMDCQDVFMRADRAIQVVIGLILPEERDGRFYVTWACALDE